MKEELITKAYEIAKERYAAVGVDVASKRQYFPCFRRGENILYPFVKHFSFH